MSAFLGRTAAALLATCVLWQVAALAEDPRVEVVAEVVLASTQGNVVDPSLVAMKDKFAERTRYTSFRRLSYTKLTLSRSAAEVSLPNHKTATLRLEELKAGTAKVKVDLPPLNTTYTLGREGSLYLSAGKHQGGELWLVLSPVEAAHPRTVRPIERPLSSLAPRVCGG